MYCPYCRNDIEEGTVKCNHCGKNLDGRFNYSGEAKVGAPAREMVMGPVKVEKASSVERADFTRKTYTHLALAILAFIILESMLLKWYVLRIFIAFDD